MSMRKPMRSYGRWATGWLSLATLLIPRASAQSSDPNCNFIDSPAIILNQTAATDLSNCSTVYGNVWVYPTSGSSGILLDNVTNITGSLLLGPPPTFLLPDWATTPPTGLSPSTFSAPKLAEVGGIMGIAGYTSRVSLDSLWIVGAIQLSSQYLTSVDMHFNLQYWSTSNDSSDYRSSWQTVLQRGDVFIYETALTSLDWLQFTTGGSWTIKDNANLTRLQLPVESFTGDVNILGNGQVKDMLNGSYYDLDLSLSSLQGLTSAMTLADFATLNLEELTYIQDSTLTITYSPVSPGAAVPQNFARLNTIDRYSTLAVEQLGSGGLDFPQLSYAGTITINAMAQFESDDEIDRPLPDPATINMPLVTDSDTEGGIGVFGYYPFASIPSGADVTLAESYYDQLKLYACNGTIEKMYCFHSIIYKESVFCPKGKAKPNVGVIVGAVAGAVGGILVSLGAFCFFRNLRRKQAGVMRTTPAAARGSQVQGAAGSTGADRNRQSEDADIELPKYTVGDRPPVYVEAERPGSMSSRSSAARMPESTTRVEGHAEGGRPPEYGENH